MTKLRRFAVLALLALVAASPTFAQGTTGAIEGKVTDDQGLALPGANVTATRPSTGFTRSTVTDANGVFRLPGLLVGAYTVKVELTGFAPSLHSVIVNVAATTTPDVRMKVAGQTEQVTVMAETPIIDTTDSGVGEVITSEQIANLPLNGRQFGNLAALAPGVSLGFHTDPTKSTQFAPQVGGGGGRNINYLIDGGDNNDDTVGGMVQNFPLDSIGEFNFETSRFRADTGRANGGTIKVVTKSGTNQLQGSGFGYFRNDALNSQTETEKNAGVDKGDYERYQYGASLGGPIIKDRTHFFASFERIQQDTTQAVNTKGLYPGEGRRLRHPLPREHDGRQADAPDQPEQLPVRALRLQRQQPALRRRRVVAARVLGRQQEHVPLREPEPELGARAAASSTSSCSSSRTS